MPRQEVPQILHALVERRQPPSQLQTPQHDQIWLSEDPRSGVRGHRGVQVRRRTCFGHFYTSADRKGQRVNQQTVGLQAPALGGDTPELPQPQLWSGAEMAWGYRACAPPWCPGGLAAAQGEGEGDKYYPAR